MYGFGNNGDRQLGIVTSNQMCNAPVEITDIDAENIKMLSAGNEHSMALTGINKFLFVMG